MSVPVIDFGSNVGIVEHYPYDSVHVGDGDDHTTGTILPPGVSCHCRAMTDEEVDDLLRRLLQYDDAYNGDGTILSHGVVGNLQPIVEELENAGYLPLKR